MTGITSLFPPRHHFNTQLWCKMSRWPMRSFRKSPRNPGLPIVGEGMNLTCRYKDVEQFSLQPGGNSCKLPAPHPLTYRQLERRRPYASSNPLPPRPRRAHSQRLPQTPSLRLCRPQTHRPLRQLQRRSPRLPLHRLRPPKPRPHRPLHHRKDPRVRPMFRVLRAVPRRRRSLRSIRQRWEAKTTQEAYKSRAVPT
jgi:hypothetical protein